MRIRVPIAVVILVGVAAGAAWFLGVGRSAGGNAAASPPATDPAEPSDEDAEAERTLAPLPVAGIVVERAPFVVTVRATGRAEAHRRAELALPVAGRIDHVSVQGGDRVESGAVLVELDPRVYEIARNEAIARESVAEGTFRVRALSDTALTGERRLAIEHQSGLTEAREQLARTELDLEGTRLVAPFAGQVAEVEAVVGALARREEPLLTLVDLDPVRIRADVLESDYGRVERGASVRVRFPAYPGETFTGELEALGPEIDAARGTGVAYVTLPNPDGRLKPGMYAELEIAGSVHADRIAVPRSAVLERDRRLLVFRARDGRAEWQYVQVGLETREAVEIVSGIAPGDTVLVEGHLTLAHGAPIQLKLRPE